MTRMQQLEKDLYYYKKTSRDLKRRLRIQGGEGDTHADNDGCVTADRHSICRMLHCRDPEEQHMVRVSRRELKRLSTEEVGLRKSQADRIQAADATIQGAWITNVYNMISITELVPDSLEDDNY